MHMYMIFLLEEFAVTYDLHHKQKNGYACMHMEKGFYCLSQASIIANEIYAIALPTHG